MKKEGYDGVFLSPEDIIVLHDMIIDESEFNDDKGFIDGTGALFENAYYAVKKDIYSKNSILKMILLSGLYFYFGMYLFQKRKYVYFITISNSPDLL